jgi:hypothetical protein
MNQHVRSRPAVAGPAIARRVAVLIAVALLGAGCAAATPSQPSAASGLPVASLGPAPSGARPASTAKLTVVSPAPNEVIQGSTVHIQIEVTGATIVIPTSNDIRPDQGHIHLYIDNNLVSMNYGTAQDIPAVPGTHVLRAEFVAADHFPFDPRDVTPDIVFTVKP